MIASKPTITEILIANAAAAFPLSMAALGKFHNVSVRSLHEGASRLRRAGRLRASERQVTRAVRVSEAIPSRPATALRHVLLDDDDISDGVFTAAGRRKKLTLLGQRGPEPVQVQALKTLEEIDRQIGRQVGPPDPMTDEELIERGGRVLYALGPTIGDAAIRWALEHWKSELPSALPGDSSDESSAGATAGSVPGDDVHAAEPVNDLETPGSLVSEACDAPRSTREVLPSRR